MSSVRKRALHCVFKGLSLLMTDILYFYAGSEHFVDASPTVCYATNSEFTLFLIDLLTTGVNKVQSRTFNVRAYLT